MFAGRDGKSVLADFGHRVRLGMGTNKHGIANENEGFPCQSGVVENRYSQTWDIECASAWAQKSMELQMEI